MMNDKNNKENHHTTTSTKEALVQKLQGALQEFRRERDQLHRSKELALERCRLVQEEEQGLSKTVEFLKQKNENLSKASLEIRSELGPLEASVKDKTKQMQFQHAELLGARDKIQQLNREMEQSAKEREDHSFKARQLVCQQRNKSEALEWEESDKPMMSLEEQKEGLTRELNSMFDWTSILPNLMEQKASTLSSKTQSLRAEMERMNEEMSNDYPHPSSAIAPQIDPRPMEDDGGKPGCDNGDLAVSNMMQPEEALLSTEVFVGY